MSLGSHRPLRRGQRRRIDRGAAREEFAAARKRRAASPSIATTVRNSGSVRCCSTPGAERQFGADVAQRIEKAPAAKSVERDQRRGARMLQRPGQLARRREGADRGDDGADLGGAERGDDPFGAVGDQHRDPVAAPDTDQRASALANASTRALSSA